MLNCEKINLKKGSKGDQVKEIQVKLKKLGFYQGVLDGDYGDMTVDAVKKYQRTQHLLEDGIVGPVTCKVLNSTDVGVTHVTSDIHAITGHKFYRNTISEAAKVYRTHIKNNKNYPNYLTMEDSAGKIFNIGRSAYMGIFEDVSRFAVKNGREPNYVVADGTANNPLAIDYQNNSVNCGPTSLSMGAQMLGIWVSELSFAKACGTSRLGTGPAELIKGAERYGIKMYAIDRTYEAVRKSINEGSPVIAHIHTSYAGGRSCLGYSGSYGHYILIYGVSGDYYLIADPTKGFKKCYYSSINNARSSTNMKFYRMDPA